MTDNSKIIKGKYILGDRFAQLTDPQLNQETIKKLEKAMSQIQKKIQDEKKKHIQKRLKDDILEICKNKIDNKELISEYPHQERVIAIGDIHCDLDGLLKCLVQVAKVIKITSIKKDKKNIQFEWIGGKTMVIVVGDMIDRLRSSSIHDKDGYLIGEIDDEEDILLDFLNRVALAADEKGGKLIKLLGNHEVMNLYGAHKYVSQKTLESNENRNELTKPGGLIARKIIHCGTLGIVKVGDWVFVHGGILPALVKTVKEKIKSNDFMGTANRLARKLFIGKINEKETELANIYFLENNLRKEHGDHDSDHDRKKYKTEEEYKLYTRRDSMLTERRLSASNYSKKVDAPTICKTLRNTFKMLGFSEDTNIVVAHSVQLERGLDNKSVSGYIYKTLESTDKDRLVYVGPGIKYDTSSNPTNVNIFPHGINYECPYKDTNKQYGQIWRIDIGMSRGFDTVIDGDEELIKKILRARRPSALEILYDKTTKQYTTKVLIAKKGLDRPYLKSKDGNFKNLNFRDEGEIYD